jgi:hypothetical protein
MSVLFLFIEFVLSYNLCQKIAVSISDDIIGFFIDLIFRASLWPWDRLIL